MYIGNMIRLVVIYNPLSFLTRFPDGGATQSKQETKQVERTSSFLPQLKVTTKKTFFPFPFILITFRPDDGLLPFFSQWRLFTILQWLSQRLQSLSRSINSWSPPGHPKKAHGIRWLC
jgi:hypothetical protein